MVTRRSGSATLGGDTIQIRSLTRELECHGCKTQVNFDGKVSPVDFDLVHVFNIDRPQDTIAIATEAKRKNKPVILTPIFVDYREFDRRGRMGFSGKITRRIGAEWNARAKIFVRAVKNGEFHAGTWKVLLSGFFRMQQSLLRKADYLLPNSESEMHRLSRRFGVDMNERKWKKIENAVDPNLFHLPAEAVSREGVLCVARVEGIKN